MMGSHLYAQIVAVKKKQIDDYKRQYPRVTFFELPEHDALPEHSIGYSRYYMKQLAHILCQDDFPFCAILDDNVKYWKGVTLKNDPLWTATPPTHETIPALQGFKAADPERRQTSDVRQVTVLQHFQTHADTLRDFAMVGFGKFRPKGANTVAYRKSHVYSVYLLNLSKLRHVEYDPRHWVMEDIWFNRLVAQAQDPDRPDKKLVICKCQRWQFHKPMQTGGCDEGVVPALGPVSPGPTPPLEPVVVEGSLTYGPQQQTVSLRAGTTIPCVASANGGALVALGSMGPLPEQMITELHAQIQTSVAAATAASITGAVEVQVRQVNDVAVSPPCDIKAWRFPMPWKDIVKLVVDAQWKDNAPLALAPSSPAPTSTVRTMPELARKCAALLLGHGNGDAVLPLPVVIAKLEEAMFAKTSVGLLPVRLLAVAKGLVPPEDYKFLELLSP
jgi:hypothetical protein